MARDSTYKLLRKENYYLLHTEMKAILALIVFIGVALCEDQADLKYFVYKNSAGELAVEDLTGEAETRVATTDLTFHYFSQNNPLSGIRLTLNDASQLRNSAFHNGKETIILIHGWKGYFNQELNLLITEKTLSSHDVNIFVVDWSPIGDKNYLSAKGSVTKVGQVLAEFVKVLQNNYGLQLSKLTLVGHSLGAHVAGGAGAALKGQVARIVALDSAGPLFSANDLANRLDITDAQFVQAIHTNGGGLGYKASHGHADYYANGGSSQPGCGIDLGGGCAHARSWRYYAEAIATGGFVGVRCDSYSNFSSGKCSTGAKSRMGEYGLDTNARGDYYLDTNNQSLFARF